MYGSPRNTDFLRRFLLPKELPGCAPAAIMMVIQWPCLYLQIMYLGRLSSWNARHVMKSHRATIYNYLRAAALIR